MRIKKYWRKFYDIFGVKLSDITFFIKCFLVFLTGFTFFTLVQYTSSQTYAQSTDETVQTTRTADNSADGFYDSLQRSLIGYWLLSQSCPNGSPIAESAAAGKALYADNPCTQLSEAQKSTVESGYINMDFGATGRLLNMASGTADIKIAQPATTVQYYASRLKGTTLAAENSKLSGREVLAPMFFLSQASKNLAYGLIVVMLVVSSLSILLSYLGKSEQKISIAQVMINAAMTLFFVTFFYEIAAIIYDLGYNYGNSLVASVMEPYINAQFILRRMQPGGDANLTALVNTFQFSGVSQGVATVANNVFLGLKPAITQSMGAIASTMGNGLLGDGILAKGFSALMSTGAGGTSYMLGGVISGVLGSQAIFDAIIAFFFFFTSIKIWANVLTAFVTYNIYVGIGPLAMLSGLSGGFDKISNTFKTLFAYALVFPTTLLFILLGSAIMNFRVKENLNSYGQTSDTQEIELCKYRTNDPLQVEDSLAERWLLNGFGDDPTAFRKENTEFQDLIDTTPAFYDENGLASCRPAIAPVPWVMIWGGNYGNRLLQIQTADTLMRTLIAMIMLIMATRAGNLVKEMVGVKEMQALQGLGRALKSGVGPVMSLAGIGVGSGIGLTMKALTKAPGLIKTQGLKRFQGSDTYKSLQNRLSDPSRASIADLYKGLKVSRLDTGAMQGQLGQYSEVEKQAATSLSQQQLAKNGGAPLTKAQEAQIASEAQLIARNSVSNNLIQMKELPSTILQTGNSMIEMMTSVANAAGKAAEQLAKIGGLAMADDFN